MHYERVLITGGAGFLARAIYARAQLENWPSRFTCLSRDDGKHALIRGRWPDVACVRADVSRDGPTLRAAFAGQDLVIHAAATKYVDVSERSVDDTIAVNVEGTRNVIEAAIEARVPRVLLISTDKAVEPANVYGASKMLGERLFLEADRWNLGTSFRVVRYGNVIGSTGSVVPVFRKQLAQWGHVMVTDPLASRFWMSWDQAVDAVSLAAESDDSGIYVPRCAALPIRAVLLCMGIPESSWKVTGMRAGEKRHEALYSAGEASRMIPAESYDHSLGGLIVDDPEPKRWTPGVPRTSDEAPRFDLDEFTKLTELAEHV